MGDKIIRICSSCGEALEIDDAFCKNCGASFEEKGEQNEGGLAIGSQLLELANNFLCVSGVNPQRFEFASRSGAQVPGQKGTIKYQAVAQLAPEKNEVLFWEKMTESLVGIDADTSHEGTLQKSIDVNQQIHGYLMFGGPYGFHYDKLHRVVKAITNEQGWQFKLVMSKPAMDTSVPPHAAQERSRKDTSPVCGACVEGPEEAAHPATSRKSIWIPLILAGAAILIVAVALIGIRKETTISEKPRTAAVPHEEAKSQKAGGVEQKPSVSAPPTAIDYNAEGIREAKAGKMEEAAVLFEKAVQAHSDNFNAWNNLGLALRKIGKNEEAVTAYQRAITVKPDFALVYKNLGIVLEQMGKKKEAADAYRRYSELNPSAADARTAREKAETLIGVEQGKGAKR
ncbi:MAG: tetratricopeptide repeat protein [Syntrophaceae bacterium]